MGILIVVDKIIDMHSSWDPMEPLELEDYFLIGVIGLVILVTNIIAALELVLKLLWILLRLIWLNSVSQEDSPEEG